MATELPEFVMTDATSSEEVDDAVDMWIELHKDDPDIQACESEVSQYVRGAAHMYFNHLTTYATDPDPERRTMRTNVWFTGGQYTLQTRVMVPHVTCESSAATESQG